MEKIEISDIIQLSLEEINERLPNDQREDRSEYLTAALKLADVYDSMGILDFRDSVLLKSQSFRDAWLTPDEELLRQVSEPKLYSRTQLVAFVANMSEVTGRMPHKTYVFYDDGLDDFLDGHEQIQRLEDDPRVVLSRGLPDDLPKGARDVIILIRGRPEIELQPRRREGDITPTTTTSREVPRSPVPMSREDEVPRSPVPMSREDETRARYDPSLTTGESERISNAILKYGEYAKIIIILGFYNPLDYWATQESLFSYDWKEAVDYILSYYDPRTENFTYHISGSIGINTIEEHRLLRSWKYVYRHVRHKYPYIDYVRTHPLYDITQVGAARDRTLWGVRSSLLNTFESDSLRIFDKKNLPIYMSEKFDDADTFVPVTKVLSQFGRSYKQFRKSFDTVCIFKPTGAMACAGKGIQRVSNEDEYTNAVNTLRQWFDDKRQGWIETESRKAKIENIEVVAPQYIKKERMRAAPKYTTRGRGRARGKYSGQRTTNITPITWKPVESVQEVVEKAVDVKSLAPIELETQSNTGINADKWMENAIISVYIDNPLLYGNRKLHFRVYIIVTTWGKIEWYGRFDCMRAAKQYQRGEYTDKEIHDTHLSGTEYPVIYPDDFGGMDPALKSKLDSSINHTMMRLTQAMVGKGWAYPETKYSYEFLGIDLLPDDQGNCWLIEVNTIPGMSPQRTGLEVSRTFHVDVARWIHEVAIEPIVNILIGVRVVRVEHSTEKQRHGLLDIASDPFVMKNVGKGNTWDELYIEDMYKLSLQDAKNPDRGYYNWILMDGEKVVGFVQMRRGVEYFGHRENNNEMQIRVFVKPRNKGYGLRALTLVNNENRDKKLYAIVADHNALSLSLFRNSGLYTKVDDNVTAYGEKSTVFVRK